MVFSSPLFIFYFLPIFLITYFRTPNKFKNFTCLLFSIFFYAWGAPKILPLLLFSCLLDFLISKKLKNKTILILGISYNVASLIYFKYANFFISELNSLAGKDLVLLEINEGHLKTGAFGFLDEVVKQINSSS